MEHDCKKSCSICLQSEGFSKENPYFYVASFVLLIEIMKIEFEKKKKSYEQVNSICQVRIFTCIMSKLVLEVLF